MKSGIKSSIFIVLCLTLVVFAGQAYPHCQIPCGIYGDDLRFDLISEDIDTVEKSMRKIAELSGSEDIDYNQLVRWVNNKEAHAEKISEKVTYYFMAQRITPRGEGEKGYDDYVRKITLLHRLQVLAMKAKQSIDLDIITRMRDILEEFEHAYKGVE